MAANPFPTVWVPGSPNRVKELPPAEIIHGLSLGPFGKRRVAQWSRNVGSSPSTWSSVGTAATFDVVGTGSNAGNEDTNGPFELCETLATGSGDSAGRITSLAIAKRCWSPLLVFHIRTGGSNSSIGDWIGFASANLAGVDNPNTEHVAAVRFNTGAGDATTWKAVTNDGGGTPTVTNGAVNRTTNTEHWGAIELDEAAGEARFYMTSGGVWVSLATLNTHLPGQTTALYVMGVVTTKTTVLKRLALDYFALAQR